MTIQSDQTNTNPDDDNRFDYDTSRLSKLTSDAVYKAGLLYFKEDRVLEHFQQQQRLFSQVEGSNADTPYDVELLHDEQGQLQVFCDCANNHTNNPEPVCKHAVATLLAFSAANQDQQQFTSAKETAIKDRIKRGHNEVKATHISGHPWFGTWQASSILSSTHRPQTYTVQIRSLSETTNYCTCPDLANNQLGTCKHIEAVLHHISKDQSVNPQQNEQQPPFVYQDFSQATDLNSNSTLHISQNSNLIKIQRTAHISAPLAGVIDQYFDQQGLFKGVLPGDFYLLCDAVYGNDQIVIGEDAKQAVQRLVNEQSHQLNAHKIHQQIMLSEGQLPGLNAKLYPYQIEGAAFLAANGRGLLADDMGLGKTLQAIAAATWLIQQADVKRVMIVCPASLKHQWAREIEKFTGFSSQIIQGGPDKREAQYRQDKTFFILNYELVLRDLTVIKQTLQPDLLILDEAQRIKNWRTKVAASIKLIPSRYAFVLTGTPLENRLEDLYSLMQVVDQRVLGPLWRYLSDYHITDDKGKVLGYRDLSGLRQRISPLMLRRNRSIVSHQLPGRTTVRLDVPMSEQQIELHDAALSNAGRIARIAKTRPLSPSERNKLMASLQQARMACDAAGLVDHQTTGSPKLKELKTLIEELCLGNGLKMVVFSQWRTMTTMVELLLKQMGVGFVHLHGGVPGNKRGNLTDRFKNDDSVSVFISTDAGGTGLNLQSASVLVNLDIPWNPAILEQRNARIHRLGQTNKVQIILMIAEHSYEERVYQLVNNKQDLFDNVVDPNGTEDIVGVSKKALTAVLDDLGKDLPVTDSAAIDGEQMPDIIQPETETDEPASQNPVKLPPMLQSDENGQQAALEDNRLKQGLLDIQQHFGNRIERLMAKGGGLLLILNAIQDNDDEFITSLELTVPVALLDIKTIRQLQTLGIDTITYEAQAIELPQTLEPTTSRWITQAKEKLAAATTLVNQQVNSGVIELICSAVASLLTDMAQQNQLMAIESIPVWLYSQAIPEQLLDMEQAHTISRVTGLRLANPVPDELLVQALDEVTALVSAVA